MFGIKNQTAKYFTVANWVEVEMPDPDQQGSKLLATHSSRKREKKISGLSKFNLLHENNELVDKILMRLKTV